ncbi:MAG TPA: membrane protein insertase YidC [Usitatibacter sp.]|jgi:YidC/Oxa1 family membrane protein insertase|nr:membrane protein insertase YidC [Usitatibacter sp.]
MMDTQRLIALVIFSVSAVLLWDAWQKHNAPVPVPGAQVVPSSVPSAPAIPNAPSAASANTASTVPAEGANVPVSNASVMGTTGTPVSVRTDLFDIELNTMGGDIRKLTLLKVGSATDRNKALTLLSTDPQHFFVTQSGLLGDSLPTHKTIFTPESTGYVMPANADSLVVRLTARTPEGAEVIKRYTFHRGSYEIDVGYDVKNASGQAIPATAYFQFLRDSNPPSQEAAQTSHFGGVSTFLGAGIYTEESKYVKVDFKDIDKDKHPYPASTKDGWIALVQHYFVSAWAPKPGVERDFFTTHVVGDLYTAGIKVPMGTIAPGATASVTVPLYIGPQQTDKLREISPGLDLVVDYGWLTILAKPIFWLLKWIHSVVQNWGWSIIILTILIKLAFYPLNAKAGRSMAQMKVLQPKMEKLKQLYGEDRQKLNQAMMELYRTEKINPLGGCLPIVVQIPVFIALYWVLLGSIELRHAPWVGWIHDLSAPDPFFILPVIYAVSMFAQTRLNPQPADPVQAKVMLIMPIMFSIFFLFFPAGLVLYWVVQNLLSIVQQWHINRTIAAEAKAKARR